MTEEELDRFRGIKSQFPMFKNTPTLQGKRFCYLDTAATSFKPERVIEAADDYYRRWCANTHRGDYDLGHEADVKYLEARRTVADFIGAESSDEVVFTSGCTDSINRVAIGLAGEFQPGDQIVIDRAEHASNILPWFNLASRTGSEIVYAPLDEMGRVTPEALKSVITPRTKLVAIARITNVMGARNDVEALCRICGEAGIYSLVDAAQSIGCERTDVKKIGCDFLCFSGHKMYGPTGIGVLYGRREILKNMLYPAQFGGGMNSSFYPNSTLINFEDIPTRFEAGTQNISGASGLAEACRFLTELDPDLVGERERSLCDRVKEALKGRPGIHIYNPYSNTGILTFNVEGIPSQDEGTLLNSRGICVRSGLHCAKILPGVPNTGTVRASFGVYSDEEDADQLIDALIRGGDILDAYFD